MAGGGVGVHLFFQTKIGCRRHCLDLRFVPPVPSQEVADRQAAQLAEAIQTLEADRHDPGSLIWVGRRYAYTGQYRQAIEVFTHGVENFPEDARFLRHRGHRYISVREFDRAVRDYSEAAKLIEGTEDEVEPDGQPNALGIPTSTLHFNIWYHYGLALFVQGAFEESIPVYRSCMEASVHPDSKAATAHWLYMALRRAGHRDEAKSFVQGLDLAAWEPDIIESGSYFALLELYQEGEATGGTPAQEMDPNSMEGAALGYGLGNYFLYNGMEAEAREVFQRIVSAPNQWASFGFIAAEADLARLGGL